mmetsp:Transcript_865/g.2809  ORF Transcript_865/g.2809 Transcript_865/m.2809 type:complete len:297 (+) Transcript_865:2170-3060(+)
MPSAERECEAAPNSYVTRTPPRGRSAVTPTSHQPPSCRRSTRSPFRSPASEGAGGGIGRTRLTGHHSRKRRCGGGGSSLSGSVGPSSSYSSRMATWTCEPRTRTTSASYHEPKKPSSRPHSSTRRPTSKSCTSRLSRVAASAARFFAPGFSTPEELAGANALSRADARAAASPRAAASASSPALLGASSRGTHSQDAPAPTHTQGPRRAGAADSAELAGVRAGGGRSWLGRGRLVRRRRASGGAKEHLPPRPPCREPRTQSGLRSHCPRAGFGEKSAQVATAVGGAAAASEPSSGS